jgi:catechol 2,3-dioxygenase-like lactoylglutathione lyase family enzyme
VLPVSDVDRAKDFYVRLGWRLDADVVAGDDFRVVQLTPPGSPCSIIFGTGITTAAPGSADGLYIVVDDIQAVRAELIERGAAVSDVFHDAGGVFHHAGTTARLPGPDPERTSYASFASFSDPDGTAGCFRKSPPSSLAADTGLRGLRVVARDKLDLGDDAYADRSAQPSSSPTGQ